MSLTEVANESPAPTRPIPIKITIHGNSFSYVIEPEDFALWAHCESGMTHEEFIDWLTLEFAALDSIDSTCEK